MTVVEPDVALVFSPEPWVESLHRHLTDHGGARIRQVVLDPGLALEDDYGVLVVSQRWPALTHAFVSSLHAAGRRILGVFDNAEPAGREHLTALGVDAALPADAPVDEFIRLVAELAPCSAMVGGRRPPPEGEKSSSGRRFQVTVVGGPAGAGSTEVAITLAALSVDAGRSTALLDADEVAPAVAVRLGLDVEPNLRTAIEAVEYGLGDLGAAVQRLPLSLLPVIVGVPNPAGWSDVRAGEVLDVVDALARSHRHVVVDTASRIEHLAVDGQGRHAISRSMLERADVIVGVAASTPSGIAGVIHWVAEVRALNRRAPMHLVLNRAPTETFRRSELSAEVLRTATDARVAFAPADRRVDSAAWDGTPVARGPFFRSIGALAVEVLPSVVPTHPRSRGFLSRRSRARRQ